MRPWIAVMLVALAIAAVAPFAAGGRASSGTTLSATGLAVGGAGSIKGTLAAALILGVVDVAGKYYVPEVGAFVIYALMVMLLILFPAGLYGRRA